MSNDRFDGQFSTAISTITAIDLKIRDIYIKSVLFNWYTNQKYRLGFGRRISEYSKIHTISALLMQVTSARYRYSSTPYSTERDSIFLKYNLLEATSSSTVCLLYSICMGRVNDHIGTTTVV